MTRRTMFYEVACRIDREEYNTMIAEIEIEAGEANLAFEDYNTEFRDVSLESILMYLHDLTDEDFKMTFNIYSQNRLYIIMDGKKVDSYAALISG